MKPESVFRHFLELTKIPRESGNEKAVAEYIFKLAKSFGLEAIKDDAHNVVVYKPATNCSDEPVILQAHTDMVCVKEPESTHDFAKDPIQTYVEDGWLRAKGTTLGADNGIGCAMILSVLEDKTLSHPPITALFTATEETGMDGIIALGPSVLKGKRVINLDSEAEGIILSSSAGGVNHKITLPVEYEESNLPTCEIKISGLPGGHSGLEIGENRPSAIRVMARLLTKIAYNKSHLVSINGGEKLNAIASSCNAVVAGYNLDTVQLVADIEREFPGTTINVSTVPAFSEKHMTKNSTWKVAKLLRLAPFGVQTYSQSMKGFVESSANLGLVSTDDNSVVLQSSVRSSVPSLKAEIVERLDLLADELGGEYTKSHDYPEWRFNPDSKLRETMVEVFREKYKKDPVVSAIHAGLECGFISQKLGEADIVSIGPDHIGAHTPSERVSIESVERVFDYLLEVLRRI